MRIHEALHTYTDESTGVDFTVHRKLYLDPDDSRLRRNVNHDSRSLDFQVKEKPRSVLASARWKSNIPTLDQGELGSCVGNSTTKTLSYDQFWSAVQSLLSTVDATVDETFAVKFYSDCTKADSYAGTYPPKDTGSDGLTAGKVAKARGYISGYQHCTTLGQVTTTLAEKPTIAGTEWRQDMFNPDRDGRLHITGDVAGGHEYTLEGVDFELKRIWMHNSWNDSWGVDGCAYYTFDDFDELMHAEGDITPFTPLDTAPVPVKPDDMDQMLYDFLIKFFGAPKRYYADLQKILLNWMRSKKS